MNNQPLSYRKRLTAWMLSQEQAVASFLGMLSIAAVALVVSGELMKTNWTIPVLEIPWEYAQRVARTSIWAVFIATFATYCLIGRRPFSYCKNHILEIIICACWLPHYTEASLHVFSRIFVLSNVLPMDILALTGTLAHAWNVLRFTERRFKSHPVFITGAAALLLVASASALLQRAEPQTFHTFWDAAWFSLTTVTTIGFGDLVPKTPLGRLITAGLIITGISLAGIFLGLVSEIVRNKLFPGMDLNKTSLETVRAELDETKKVVEQLRDEQARTNVLLQQLLEKQKNGGD